MSAADRELALNRFRLLEPHLTEGRELRSLAEGASISFRTLQRWLAAYRDFGLAALVRKSRADCGCRRVTSVRLREAVEGLAPERPRLPHLFRSFGGQERIHNRNMLTAIEVPLYDVGVLSDRRMPGATASPLPGKLERLQCSSTAMPAARTSASVL